MAGGFKEIGVGKTVKITCLQPINHSISETIEDRHKVTEED